MKRILTGDLAKNQINLPPKRIIIDEVYVRFSLSSAKGNGGRANNFARAAFARKDLGGKVNRQYRGHKEG
jgi:hypothetical protein